MTDVTYIWKIVEIKAYPTFEDKTDVVCTVVWQLVATNGEYGSQLQGSIDVPTQNINPFTPYEQLTEEQVLGWVYDVMGPAQVLSYEQSVLAGLELMINPPIVNLPLPWEIQSEPTEEVVPPKDEIATGSE
jgi:hypothetical protein